MIMVGIYTIRNRVNNKRYVGQSIHIDTRFKEHIKALKDNQHYNVHLQASWNQYGEENFSFEVLEECSREQLNDRETYWKKYYDPQTYNLGHTGNVHTMSLETREKMRKVMNELNSSLTPEERSRKYGHKKNAGRIWSEEYKKRISDKLKGRPSYIRTEECRKKSSLKNQFRQTIFQFTSEGKFLRAWPTIVSCIKSNPQLDQGAISSCCLLQQKTTKGYTFRYAKPDDLHLLEIGYIPTLF